MYRFVELNPFETNNSEYNERIEWILTNYKKLENKVKEHSFFKSELEKKFYVNYHRKPLNNETLTEEELKPVLKNYDKINKLVEDFKALFFYTTDRLVPHHFTQEQITLLFIVEKLEDLVSDIKKCIKYCDFYSISENQAMELHSYDCLRKINNAYYKITKGNKLNIWFYEYFHGLNYTNSLKQVTYNVPVEKLSLSLQQMNPKYEDLNSLKTNVCNDVTSIDNFQTGGYSKEWFKNYYENAKYRENILSDIEKHTRDEQNKYEELLTQCIENF